MHHPVLVILCELVVFAVFAWLVYVIIPFVRFWITGKYKTRDFHTDQTYIKVKEAGGTAWDFILGLYQATPAWLIDDSGPSRHYRKGKLVLDRGVMNFASRDRILFSFPIASLSLQYKSFRTLVIRHDDQSYTLAWATPFGFLVSVLFRISPVGGLVWGTNYLYNGYNRKNVNRNTPWAQSNAYSNATLLHYTLRSIPDRVKQVSDPAMVHVKENTKWQCPNDYYDALYWSPLLVLLVVPLGGYGQQLRQLLLAGGLVWLLIFIVVAAQVVPNELAQQKAYFPARRRSLEQ